MKNLIKRGGQSTLELAIFGSILLSLLAAIVSYGLRYNYQQKIMMQAFRRSGQSVPSDGGTGSYKIYSDMHIPNPSDPFAVGSVTPVAGADGVIKNGSMSMMAQDDSGLPRTTLDINNGKSNATSQSPYKIAAFFYPPNVTQDQIKRYEFVFGSSNVCQDASCGAGEPVCNGDTTTDPYTGEPTCGSFGGATIKIVDPYGGQIASFDSMNDTCLKLQNYDYCWNKCMAEGQSDCNVCQPSLASDQLPAYCGANGAKSSLFPFTDIEQYKVMGIGADRDVHTEIHNDLALPNAETLNWDFSTTRNVHTYNGAGGYTESPVTTDTGENAY